MPRLALIGTAAVRYGVVWSGVAVAVLAIMVGTALLLTGSHVHAPGSTADVAVKRHATPTPSMALAPPSTVRSAAPAAQVEAAQLELASQ
jgi:hypothetical protein